MATARRATKSTMMGDDNDYDEDGVDDDDGDGAMGDGATGDEVVIVVRVRAV